MELLFSM